MVDFLNTWFLMKWPSLNRGKNDWAFGLYKTSVASPDNLFCDVRNRGHIKGVDPDASELFPETPKDVHGDRRCSRPRLVSELEQFHLIQKNFQYTRSRVRQNSVGACGSVSNWVLLCIVLRKLYNWKRDGAVFINSVSKLIELLGRFSLL